MCKFFHKTILIFALIFLKCGLIFSSDRLFINHFESNRWSSINIYTAWMTCRNNVIKWEWTNDKISNLHCACLIDWQRPIIFEMGPKYSLEKIDKTEFKLKAEQCFKFAKLTQDKSFGHDFLKNKEEPKRLETASIVNFFKTCFNSRNHKIKKFKTQYCGCSTDSLRNIYQKYGRKKTLNAIFNRNGKIWKEYKNSLNICNEI